jgi:Antitoxin VbhA
MTDDPKPTITPEETQRRRVHVRVAISENRLEGIATSAATLEICEAYIRGEIEAGDLVTAFLHSSARSADTTPRAREDS